jgi:hypothetical protein
MDEGIHQIGVVGEPIPYSPHTDDLLSSLLLVCFVILLASIAHSRHFIIRQVKDIFYTSHNDGNISETSVELRFQLFLVLLLCLELAIYTYEFTSDRMNCRLDIGSSSLLISLFFVIYIAYHGIKALIYTIINNVFFNRNINRQWLKIMMFISASEGVLFFPATLLLINLDVPFHFLFNYLLFVLFLVKFLTFYKCKIIFFRQNDFFLQTILYFCTLEIAPLLNLIGGLLILIDNLKQTF